MHAYWLSHFVNYKVCSHAGKVCLWTVHNSLKMAVFMKLFFVLVAGMLFGSLTAKPVKDPAPSRYYYDDESNDYFDVGKLLPILYRKRLSDS